MGFKTEINWILKVNDGLENLKENEIKEFVKEGSRVYPVGVPILLADNDWSAEGYVILKKAEVSDVGSPSTKIAAKIVKLFDKNEKEVLSKILRQMYGRR